MKKLLFSLFIFSCLFFPGIIHAQSELGGARNPFVPQLPAKKIEAPAIVEQAPPAPAQPTARSARRETAPAPRKEPTEPAPVPTLDITGLVWNTNRPQAIVNGQVLDVGDSVETVKIVAIRKNEIDVEFQGRLLTIKL